MAKLRTVLPVCFLAVAALLALSCGIHQPGHPLESITLSPTTADAENYPNGQVQFTATGNYMTPPLTVTPLSATWGACYQFQPTTEVSVTSTGLAQCSSGASGTFFVWANAPIDANGVYDCPANTVCGGGCVVQANALLTCP
jgi:hypothetical protein